MVVLFCLLLSVRRFCGVVPAALVTLAVRISESGESKDGVPSLLYLLGHFYGLLYGQHLLSPLLLCLLHLLWDKRSKESSCPHLASLLPHWSKPQTLSITSCVEQRMQNYTNDQSWFPISCNLGRSQKNTCLLFGFSFRCRSSSNRLLFSIATMMCHTIAIYRRTGENKIKMHLYIYIINYNIPECDV